jgi:hypothetical protein
MLSELDFKKIEYAIKCMSGVNYGGDRLIPELNVITLLKMYVDNPPHDVEKYYNREDVPKKPTPPPPIVRRT